MEKRKGRKPKYKECEKCGALSFLTMANNYQCSRIKCDHSEPAYVEDKCYQRKLL